MVVNFSVWIEVKKQEAVLFFILYDFAMFYLCFNMIVFFSYLLSEKIRKRYYYFRIYF